jgi:uncharacterized membrane protein YfhO
VLSVDPLPHPELRPLDEIRAPRIAPLSVHAYRLVPALERVQIEPGGRVVRAELGNDRLEVDVEASAPATLVIRDGWARGWIAEVNGVATSVGRVDERHRSVEVAPGPSHVVLRYRPSALAPGLAGSLLGLGIVIALLRRRRRPGGPAGAAS